MFTVKLVGVAETRGKVPFKADVVHPEVITSMFAPPFGSALKLLMAWKTATLLVTVTLVITPEN
jgi:hypothetical protein